MDDIDHRKARQRESERVAMLHRYQILDTKPEAAFDRITRLAALLFDVPVAAIAFPIEQRLWFKSTVGLDSDQGQRLAGLCAQVIERGTPLVLGDVEAEAGFKNHPTVVDGPRLRFYASAPLITPCGQRVGSLSVADIKPRPVFSDAEARRLEDLAALVVDALELRLERAQAKRANEANAAFLAAMSHEIRTPMNGVLGMADLLLSADDLNPRHRRRIDIIQRSGETLLTLLDQILDLSKIEAGTLELDSSPFDLRELILDLHALFEPRAEARNLRLDREDHLGDHQLVTGDALRIRQILSNLLAHAIKVTEQGGVRLRAAAAPGPFGVARLRLEIEAFGVSLEPAAIERLFSTFEQADRSTWSAFDATGLSLALGRKLARMMGGEVGVESVAGEGSTFWLQLDLERQEVTHAPAGTAAHARHRQDPPRASAQARDILVAEDDPDMVFLIEDMLDEAGHRVTVARDGAAVLEALEKRRFDLILMDGRMPDMSGFETTEQIRRLPDDRASIPIIALTAEAMLGDRERFLTAGMDDYLSKPVDYHRLVQAIERCCPKSSHAPGMPAEA